MAFLRARQACPSDSFRRDLLVRSASRRDVLVTSACQDRTIDRLFAGTTSVPLRFFSEGPACQVRVSEGRACHVRLSGSDNRWPFCGHDKRASNLEVGAIHELPLPHFAPPAFHMVRKVKIRQRADLLSRPTGIG
ncbi:MAG: hypothetical protein KatS3mg112_0722 [Thermogutta sp.]|nr:MAG: hypothetical protein KatS3mg112_0722 [Thermogutta sp.]